jgi:hypothetical protein
MYTDKYEDEMVSSGEGLLLFLDRVVLPPQTVRTFTVTEI